MQDQDLQIFKSNITRLLTQSKDISASVLLSTKLKCFSFVHIYLQ